MMLKFWKIKKKSLILKLLGTWADSSRNVGTLSPPQTTFPEYSPRPSSVISYQQISAGTNNAQHQLHSASTANTLASDKSEQQTAYTAAAADSTTSCSSTTGGLFLMYYRIRYPPPTYNTYYTSYDFS